MTANLSLNRTLLGGAVRRPSSRRLAWFVRRPVDSIATLWRFLVMLAVGLALFAMALMLIGTFTKEWTCREIGGSWECIGSRCDAEATKRFDTFRRTVACERTDWPMVVLDRAFTFILPFH